MKIWQIIMISSVVAYTVSIIYDFCKRKRYLINFEISILNIKGSYEYSTQYLSFTDLKFIRNRISDLYGCDDKEILITNIIKL